MLSPPLHTFRANKVTVVCVAVFALFELLVVLSTHEPGRSNSPDWTSWTFTGAFLAVMAFLFLWLLSVRVSLHPEGISYQSFLGSKEMQWIDVERFYYGATKRSINFIPVGTYYHFKLIDRQGNKISFGNRIERPAELGSHLINHTYALLFAKAADLFNSGVELDFGPIRLSRERGLRIKKLFGFKEIPLDQVADYRMEHGYFYIFKVGQKRTTGPPTREIPNAFVLLGLLNALYERPA